MHTNNTYTHTHTSPTSCYCQLRKYDVSVHKVNTDVHSMLCIQGRKYFDKGPTKVFTYISLVLEFLFQVMCHKIFIFNPPFLLRFN